MAQRLIKKISKGTRFNQIYLQKNEIGFEPGKNVVISAFDDLLERNISIFEYNIKLNSIKREIIKTIFKLIDDSCSYKNIIITGSFLEAGFNFEDIDIIIINPQKLDKDKLNGSITHAIGVKPHLILIDSQSFNKGIKRDPLFRLMVDRYVSVKRAIFNQSREINYKLLDAYLLKNKNLIDGFDLFNIKQRKKLLRDFISIKLFVENKEVTINNIEKEEVKIFGKDIIEKLFYYGAISSKREFISKLRKEFNKLEKRILKNVSKQA